MVGNWEMSPGKKHKWRTEELNLGEELGACLRYGMCEAEGWSMSSYLGQDPCGPGEAGNKHRHAEAPRWAKVGRRRALLKRVVGCRA